MTCDCEEDKFCERFQREMRGRFREICQGVNVDLGTAAAFREQWGREVKPTPAPGVPTPIILKTDQMPGDAVVMTAAVYSLHQAHPGKYVTAVDTQWPEVFAHNPDVVSVDSIFSAQAMHMHYPAIHQCNDRGIHFMQGWTSFLGQALGVEVPLLTDRPHLYFSDDTPPIDNFWLVCSGGKSDFTNKLWHGYQQVVSILRGAVRFIQIGSASDNHPRLQGAENMVGGTSLRGLFDIIRRARGVLCGVSLPMHVAAALERPAVVIAGGREPVTWNAYPKMRYLHTVGSLPCRSVQGHIGRACWRSRVMPIGDGTWYDTNTCEYPVHGVPMCMRLITPEYVAETIMQVERGYACVK